MEPFGLFNLLKSLLPQAENSEQNPADGVDNDAAPPLSSANHEESAPEKSNAPPNAFLDFVSRHEQRKQNIRK